MGMLFGSSQQTDTHWSPETKTVAVLVSVVPDPISTPAAAPPSFSLTPNHGSDPISKEELAGVTTIIALAPVGTDAVTDAAVEAVPPLTVTEHQLRKFITVRVACPPPVFGGAPLSGIVPPP